MDEQKPNNRERVKEIVAGIEKNIQELFQSERYFDYLRTMSRFHNYSLNNTLLIYAQRPNAETPIAGFQKWKQFGRHVKKGEKGLTIIAPTPLKRKIEEMKLDPDTNAPVLDQDGKIIMEEKNIEIPLFKPVKVFTADQTEGKPLPSLAADLTGDVRQYEAFMEALRRTSPMPLSIVPLPPDMDGLCNHARGTISIREGMSEVQTVCAAVHEITHAVLHDRGQNQTAAAAGEQETPPKKDKNTVEIEAEGCAFAVLAYYGIDTSANSTGYIASWSSDKDLKELKASLDTITKTTNSLITSIDRHFTEICKERGIDLTAQPEREPDTPEKYVADFLDHLQKAYDAGLISNPFSTDSREEVERFFLAELQKGYFNGFRDILSDAAEQPHLPATAALLERLEVLSDQWDAALICKVEPIVSPETAERYSCIHTYEQRDGQLVPNKVVFNGTLGECQRVMAGLEAGTFTLRDVRQPDFAPPVSTVPSPTKQEDEAFYLLDDSVYLHIQASDGGWDYTLYSKQDMTQTDGGQLDSPGLSITDVVEYIRKAENIGTLSVEFAPIEILEELLDRSDRALETSVGTVQPEQARDYAGELREHFAREDAGLLDTTLDEYPLPDSAITMDDLAGLGYSETDLLPLTRERAAELLEQDMTIYMTQNGAAPEMVFDHDDLVEQPEGTVFAVTREDWETSRDFRDAVAGRMDRQEERETAFLNHVGDCFAIYQLRDVDETRYLRYQPLPGQGVDKKFYELAYTAPLPDGADLDTLFEKFNIDHPPDYLRPSMSVSDIVALKQDGVVSCYYCDRYAFTELHGFFSRGDEPVKEEPKHPTVAELEAQVKAGQSISLMDLAAATHREQDGKRKSVAERLKRQSPKEPKKKAVKKNMERGI